MPNVTLSSLETFTLFFQHMDPSDHEFTPPSALLPGVPRMDHLSHALHRLSQSPNLTSLKISSIVITPDLYWPLSPSIPPLWPKLRHFDVEFQMTNSTGDWYFVSDPMIRWPKSETSGEPNSSSDEGDGDDQEQAWESDSSSSDTLLPDPFNQREEDRAVGDYPIRRFRTITSDALMNPLRLAQARAAVHMPKLQTMSLESTIDDFNTSGFSIYFYAAGQRSNREFDSGDTDKPRLFWRVGAWRPDNEVLKIWREGREGLLIKFI